MLLYSRHGTEVAKQFTLYGIAGLVPAMLSSWLFHEAIKRAARQPQQVEAVTV